CPASNQRLPCAAGCSRAQDPSGASPARSSARQTPGATDNTSPRSPRSGGLRPPCSGPAKPEHRLVAASQRSLQACIASLPLQSSWMSKTYLKSDHFNGGGSEPRFNFRGPDVVEILEEVGRQIGFPKAIRVDQGTEFVSRDLDLWAYQRGVTLDFSRPGKPTDNAFIESFNGKFRAECLNAHWFMSLDDAR